MWLNTTVDRCAMPQSPVLHSPLPRHGRGAGGEGHRAAKPQRFPNDAKHLMILAPFVPFRGYSARAAGFVPLARPFRARPKHHHEKAQKTRRT